MALANNRKNTMDKDQAVELMTDAVVSLNKNIAVEQNIPSEQIDEFIKLSMPQFKYVNGMLYDLLDTNGLIK
jgi:hypothetical protein